MTIGWGLIKKVKLTDDDNLVTDSAYDIIGDK